MEKAERKEKNWSRNLQRILIILSIIASVTLANTYEIISTPMSIFIGILSVWLFINLWLYEKSGSGTWFAIPLLVMCILMLLSVLSLIGWIIQMPVFAGFWADLFAWPSFITALIITFYCIALLDTEMRHSVIHFFTLKKYSKEDFS